jgi:RHS repeat-associated protein
MTEPAVCDSDVCFPPSRSTGKERDAESGLDYFGARYYASSMGRFMSPDWSAKVEPVPYSKLDDPQTLNLYGYVGNNPLSRVDADGHFADYYGTNGKKIGTDGVNDGKNYVVTDSGQAKAIGKATKAGKTSSTPSSAVLVPGNAVRSAMNASVTASNHPSGADKEGGYHEEGGIYGQRGGQEVAIPAAPGAYSPSGKVSIDPTKAADPTQSGTLSDLGGTWHVHPDGTGWIQQPSQVDIDAATAPRPYFVIGAGSGQIYFYNNTTQYGNAPSMSFKDFMKIGNP